VRREDLGNIRDWRESTLCNTGTSIKDIKLTDHLILQVNHVILDELRSYCDNDDDTRLLKKEISAISDGLFDL